MSLGWIGSAIDATASHINNIYGSKQNKKAQQREVKYQRQFYEQQRADAVADRDLAREWALEDWERETSFNSPAAQMERYRDANLNPNLVYGEGVAASAGNTDGPRDSGGTRASNHPHVNSARYNFDAATNFAQAQLFSAQAKNLDADTELKSEQAGNVSAQTERIREILPFEKDGRLIDIEKAKANIGLIGAQILSTSADVDVKAAQVVESDARVQKMYNDTLLSYFRYQNEIAKLDVDRYNAETERGRLAVYSRDVATREAGQKLDERRHEFEKQKRGFDELIAAAGLEQNAFGNLWKSLGTVITSSADVLTSKEDRSYSDKLRRYGKHNYPKGKSNPYSPGHYFK